MSSWIGLLVWIAGTSVAGVSGAVSAGSAKEFYATLDKPRWAPPAWLFGPAWTTLYVLMAIAAWRVWREHGIAGARVELTLYGVQLALNAAWSWFFFVRRSGRLALFEVSLLLAAVLATMASFWRRDPIAGLLFVPYAAWVSFATALTFSVWRRNVQALGR